MTEEARKLRNAYQNKGRKSWTTEQREAFNAYYRQWRKNNPDKVREYNERYWEKKAAEWRAAHGLASGNSEK